ncbi:hypothetical protein Tco_1255794 [Tanacetum coccineum]
MKSPPPPKTSSLEDDELVKEEAIDVSKTKPISNDLEDISLENNQIVNIKESKNSSPRKRLWYPKGSIIETIVYADSDHAGDYVDCKSTSGVCTFMGCCLTSWFLKKQTALAISTTEAEYVSAEKACQQAIWMKQALVDYGIRLDDIPIMCDNKGAIDLISEERQDDPEQLRGIMICKRICTSLPIFQRSSNKPTNNNLELLQTPGIWPLCQRMQEAKRVKDYSYHKEKMMMCKQAKQGVQLQAEQANWLEDTDEEINEQELEAHYSYMAKIQEVSPEESNFTGQPLEQVQNHDESNVFANERRHSEQPESINDTYILEKDDSNVTPDSSNICNK